MYIFDVLDLFKGKGYSCGYITTNGTIIDDERADALAALAQSGFLKHVSVSVDGPKDVYVSLCKKSAYAPFTVRRRS